MVPVETEGSERGSSSVKGVESGRAGAGEGVGGSIENTFRGASQGPVPVRFHWNFAFELGLFVRMFEVDRVLGELVNCFQI